MKGGGGVKGDGEGGGRILLLFFQSKFFQQSNFQCWIYWKSRMPRMNFLRRKMWERGERCLNPINFSDYLVSLACSHISLLAFLFIPSMAILYNFMLTCPYEHPATVSQKISNHPTHKFYTNSPQTVPKFIINNTGAKRGNGINSWPHSSSKQITKLHWTSKIYQFVFLITYFRSRHYSCLKCIIC